VTLGAKLINEGNFLQAIRETGYRSLAHAIAELVDNSIQAQATVVSVESARDESGNALLRVADNGLGLSPDMMVHALQFGGSTRFDDRNGLGRFGMGLPTSGLSLARRIEFYSWRASAPYFTVLDLDERREKAGIIRVRKVANAGRNFTSRSRSGSLVVLRNCDRLPNLERASVLEPLRLELGRIFRYYLAEGLEIRVNGKKIQPFDPLFLSTAVGGVTAKQYGPTMSYTVTREGKASAIKVRFSELPIEDWKGMPNAKKQRLGISKGAGISIVRAKREIAYGWYFMGTKRKENYDDWWRCELMFDPALDEAFRVNHTKQQISPRPEMDESLGGDIESVGRCLNARVRREFMRVASQRPGAAERRASAQDKYLPPLQAPNGLALTSLRAADYRIAIGNELGDNAFYACNLNDGTVVVDLNSKHPFAAEYAVTRRLHESERLGLDALLLAAARVELSAATNKEKWWFRHFRHQWSDVLATFLSNKG
jgi:hypothetical protein